MRLVKRQRLHISWYLAWLGITLGFVATTAQAQSQKLTVSVMPTSGEQRSAYYALAERFRQHHPDIDLQLVTYKHEHYKTIIESIMDPAQNEGELFFWFGGKRLSQLRELGYLLDLTPWWEQGGWLQYFTQASSRAVTQQGKLWALPLYYYQWGFYYQPSHVIERLKTFESWDNFIATCQTLSQEESYLVTIGSQTTWSVAAWFDYLDLRINGIDFHNRVTQGEVSFLSPEITEIFDHWQQALDAQCFTPRREQYTWQQALPELFRGKAHSILMGNFFTQTLPPRVKKRLQFAPFPTIDTALPAYEEAPLDVIVASRNADKNPATFVFLDFLASTNALLLLSEAIHTIDPLIHSRRSTDPFIQAGKELLTQAEAISQFFDRDTPPLFSEPAMKVMADYMNTKIDREQAQAKLESIRLTAFPFENNDAN